MFIRQNISQTAKISKIYENYPIFYIFILTNVKIWIIIRRKILNIYLEVNKMKSTGMVRRVDELGRIVLPIEIRKVLDIKVKDHIEIFTDDNRIILQKYQPFCIFCGNAENVVYFAEKRVCAECIEKLKQQL